MGRWTMIAIALLGGIMVAVTRSSVIAGMGVVMVLVGMIGATFSLAASRISSRSRDDTAMLSPDILQSIREKAARDSAALAARRLPSGEHRQD